MRVKKNLDNLWAACFTAVCPPWFRPPPNCSCGPARSCWRYCITACLFFFFHPPGKDVCPDGCSVSSACARYLIHVSAGKDWKESVLLCTKMNWECFLLGEPARKQHRAWCRLLHEPGHTGCFSLLQVEQWRRLIFSGLFLPLLKWQTSGDSDGQVGQCQHVASWLGMQGWTLLLPWRGLMTGLTCNNRLFSARSQRPVFIIFRGEMICYMPAA